MRQKVAITQIHAVQLYVVLQPERVRGKCIIFEPAALSPHGAELLCVSTLSHRIVSIESATLEKKNTFRKNKTQKQTFHFAFLSQNIKNIGPVTSILVGRRREFSGSEAWQILCVLSVLFTTSKC